MRRRAAHVLEVVKDLEMAAGISLSEDASDPP
jgi:hypothetical protein